MQKQLGSRRKVYVDPGLDIDFLLEDVVADRWELTCNYCDDADLLIVADEYSHDGICIIRRQEV